VVRDPEVVEIDMAAVEALLSRVKDRVSAEDYEQLRGLAETLATVTRLMQERGTTIMRLRRLFGLASSEKTADVLAKTNQGDKSATPDGKAESPAPPEDAKSGAEAESGGAEAPAKPKRKGHGRDPVSDYPDACPMPVLHAGLHAGDKCPLCGRGTLFELREPARILRIVGQPPLVGKCWNCQRFRCSGCGAVFTAKPPDEAQGPKHDDTAAAMIAYLRYRAGVPHNRLAQIQRHLATPLPASTQWDVIHAHVDAPMLIYRELLRLGAEGSVLHNDDTYMRILAFMGKRRAELLRRGELPSPERTGLFTTGVISIVGGRTLAMFFTGRKHAGENLADVLQKRAADLEAPILMCDGLERNLPKGHEVVASNCNSHGRRHFVDQAVNFPKECRYVLETYGKVFKVEQLCHTAGLSDVERLRRHQRESGPLMDEMKKWMKDQLDDKRIEPNSGMGKAIGYMLDRWDKLTLFLRVPGAPLHNNDVERALKMAIRHRNNSLFYRSERGALVGDVYMTVIYTAELEGENPFHYLTELMRHERAVAEDPVAWLPWNYRATLARLGGDVDRSREEPLPPSPLRPSKPRSVPGSGPHPSTETAPQPVPP